MSMYNLPKVKKPKTFLPGHKRLSLPVEKGGVKRVFWLLAGVMLISSLCGFLGGAVFGTYFYPEIGNYLENLNIELSKPEPSLQKETVFFSQEEAVIKVVKEASPSVVSIIVTKDLPIFEQYYLEPFEEFEEFFGGPFDFNIPQFRQKGTEKREVGGGTGFIVSENGLILTNKHVVSDKDADYTVLTNDGKRFEASVLARDPLQDIAILKIKTAESLPVVNLGNSDGLEIGQTVIAIGNVLGEYRNSISVGVISGLGRTITASGGGMVEVLEDVIQTDAAINKGNSGGPLLNLKGQVIGINTAVALVAENVGFAIPINKAKKDIEQVKRTGKIVFPFLGIYYTLITPELKEEHNLPVDYGAWVGRDKSGQQTPEPIFPGSAAQEAGLKGDDIILEFNNEQITLENSLAEIILKCNPGDRITLKILREGKEKIFNIVLDERSE